MQKFKCRYDKKNIFKTKEEQLKHEQKCPFKEKRKDLKQCKYDPAHIFDISKIEKHEKDCPTRKKLEKEYQKNKINETNKIEESNDFIINDFKSNDENQNNNEETNKNFTNKDKRGIKIINYNECFGEEDYIFKKAYVE